MTDIEFERVVASNTQDANPRWGKSWPLEEPTPVPGGSARAGYERALGVIVEPKPWSPERTDAVLNEIEQYLNRKNKPETFLTPERCRRIEALIGTDTSPAPSPAQPVGEDDDPPELTAAQLAEATRGIAELFGGDGLSREEDTTNEEEKPRPSGVDADVASWWGRR
jgi:hypothetical protein